MTTTLLFAGAGGATVDSAGPADTLVPATASPTQTGAAGLPPALATPAEIDAAAALGQALQSGSTADRFARLAAEAGQTVTKWPALAPPRTALTEAGVNPHELPPNLVEPVGRMMAAIAVASALRADAVAGLSAWERDLVLSGDLFAHDPVEPEAQGGAGATAALVTFVPRYSDAERAAIAERVDMGMMSTAAALLLETVDEVLPQLPSFPSLNSAVPGGGCADVPPSIYDNPGVLAIDAGFKRWTTDYQLIVDLGGNDCHENTAASGTGGIEIVIETNGDDLYAETSTTGGVSGIGFGSLGIGVLVDTAGTDAYVLHSVRHAPQPGPVAGTAAAGGQGSASLGVGILVDSGGNDVFDVVAHSSGGAATLNAQGTAALGGVGLLVSGPGTSTGHTTYAADARSTLHLVSMTPSQSVYSIGPGTAQAQGAAAGGAGALVDAGGNDVYRATSFGASGTTAAQGAGATGVGALIDAAGVDSYFASAEGDVALSLVITDRNFCWTVTVNVSTATTSTLAQGAAITGAGILMDATNGGRQTFVAHARSSATAHAEVATSASPSCVNSASATALTGTARTNAQGTAASGVGVLLGGTSDDLYDVHSSSDADAIALVNHGLVGTNTATATSGSAETRSHGYLTTGVGAIVDPGGNDAYRHSGATTASETTTLGGTGPGTSGAVSTIGEGWALSGVGWLLDLGGTDTYSTPAASNNACWTQPGSGAGDLDFGRGRDLSPPYVPLPASCP